MRLGNDTSRDGQGDFSQESSPGRHVTPLSEKANGLFDKLKRVSNEFDTRFLRLKQKLFLRVFGRKGSGEQL